MTNYNFAALAVSLPEDIMKKKCYGDFEGAIALIDNYLKKDIPEDLKDKLILEKEILKVLPDDYPFSFDEAFEEVKEVLPDITKKEFYELKDNGKIDWIYVNGQEKYIDTLAATLIKSNPELKARSAKLMGLKEPPVTDYQKALLAAIKDMKAQGQSSEKGEYVTYKIRLRNSIRIKDEVFEPGEVLVHLPLPCYSEETGDMKIISASSDDYHVSDSKCPQRTICFNEDLTENKEFFVSYEYKIKLKYIDAYSGKSQGERAYPSNDKCEKENDNSSRPQNYLGEQAPHIMFTPFMKALAKKIIGTETNGLNKAKLIYDYVTLNVKYAYVRAYFTIENLSEYPAIGGRGDCGIQALMFITLCRIAGVPARWQSGLIANPHEACCHDWAQFYTDEYGWLFADPSFGGGAVRDNDEDRRRFYFGNIDPYRMVANRELQMDFDPCKQFIRADPYDNQVGEIEYSGKRAIKNSEFISKQETIFALKED